MKKSDNPACRASHGASVCGLSGKHLWIAAVIEQGTHVFARAYGSKERAQDSIVAYLRKHEGYDGDSFADTCNWLSDHAERLEVQLFEAVSDRAGLCPGADIFTPCLSVQAPREAHGAQSLYRVIYAIDVNADDAQKAAEYTHRIMSDPASMPPVLHVFNHAGACETVDLSEPQEFNKVTAGSVIQTFKKDDQDRFVCVGQVFVAGDEVQYETLDGKPIEPPEYEYQPFEMSLIAAPALQEICESGLKFLESLPDTELTTELQNRRCFRKMLNDALGRNRPAVDDGCPECDADGSRCKVHRDSSSAQSRRGRRCPCDPDNKQDTVS